MSGIIGQAEQYGLPVKEARELPPEDEFTTFLRGAAITPGLMRREEKDER